MPLVRILRARALCAPVIVVALALTAALFAGCASSSGAEDDTVEVRPYYLGAADADVATETEPRLRTADGVGALPLVTLTTRFVEMPSSELAALLPHAPRAGQMLLMTDEQVAGVNALIESGADEVALLTSPRLSLFSGQRGSMIVSNQIAYLSDFVITETDDAFIADPVVDTLDEGVFMHARPVVSLPGADAGDDADAAASILLDLEVELAFVARPIRSVTVQLNTDEGPVGSEVEIQIPEVLSQTVRRNMTIVDGDTIAIVNFASQQAWETGDGSVVLVMVTTEIARD